MSEFLQNSHEIAELFLGNAAERLAAFGDVEHAHLEPTPQREQEQAEALIVALIGIGHAVLAQAAATRQHTETIKNLAAEGAL